LPAGARADARLTRLFTPTRPFGGRYAVYVTTETLEGCLAHFRRVTAGTEHPREAWEPRRLEARTAFGESGPYPRSRLARLYGGSPVFVARGSLRADGRFVASVTLFSPHPDPAFTRLEPGTMLVVFRPETPGLIAGR